MKTLYCLLVATICSMAQVNAYDSQPNGRFGVSVGFMHLAGFDESYLHDTHPSDYFLPGAGNPGSAGETEINNLDFITLGAYWEQSFFKDWLVRIEAGALIGANRDDKKNVNDPRPDANGAFIYSDAKWGIYGSASLTYQMGDFYLGGQVCLNNVFVSHGYDRWGRDESVKDSNVFLPTFGPVIGYRISESTAIHLGGHFGEVSGMSLTVSYTF